MSPGSARRKPSKRSKLSSGRPPNAVKTKTSLSRTVTSRRIREFHELNKKIAQAEARGRSGEVEQLKQRVEALGGLQAYQLASIQGQANERGGDSSIVLMEWLQDVKPALASMNPKARLLEVGALSTKNACSKARIFDIARIDLASQGEGILQQDFMQRPAPTSDHDRFDVISLSLVLNFVSSPQGRGEMLKRTCQFLRQVAASQIPATVHASFPALFLVLPASCVTNSRYMDEDHLASIMRSLGYAMLHRKQSSKLVYYLWVLREDSKKTSFKKKQVNPGPTRNNFSVVLKG